MRALGVSTRIHTNPSSKPQNDRKWNDEPQYGDGNQQRAELGIVSAPDDKNLIEILRLQLASHQRQIH